MEEYKLEDVIRLQRIIKRWLLWRRTRKLAEKNRSALRQRLQTWNQFLESENNYFVTLMTAIQVCAFSN